MAASKKKKAPPAPKSQFTPTTMALMAMSLLVGIVVGFIVGSGSGEKADKDEGSTSTSVQTSTSGTSSAASQAGKAGKGGKAKKMPAAAAQSNSPFLDDQAVAKFAEDSKALNDYRRAVGFVGRKNAKGSAPILDRLAANAGADAWAEELSLLQAANKVNQQLAPQALEELAAWKEAYPESRLMAQAVLWEGKAYQVSSRLKSGGRSGGDPTASQADMDQARQVFESVIDRFPTDTEACGEALFNLGSVYKSLGDATRSVEMFDKLVEDYPTSSLAPRALYSVGNGAWGEEDYDTAARYFKMLLDRYPEDGLAKRSRRNIKAMGVIGQDAPELVADHYIGGDTSLAKHQGKVVMLSFWNQWCPHCRKEMPKLQKMHEKYKDQGFVLISVTKHTKSQTEEGVVSFLTEQGVTFPTAVEAEGFQTTKDYAVSSVPAAVVIGRDGKIAWRNHPARLTEERLKQFLGG